MHFRSSTARSARTGLSRLTAALACATALACAGAGGTAAAPLELETPTLPAQVAAGAGDIAVGTGSASLSADPGSASGSSRSGSGAGGFGGLPPGTWPGSGPGPYGTGSGGRLGQLGPNIAEGIDSFMRGLGFRPGNYPSCAEIERAGLAPLLRGAPGFSDLLDPDGNGVACD